MNWKNFLAATLAVVIWLAKATFAATVLLGVLVAGSYLDLERVSARTANAWLMALALLAIGALFYGIVRLLVRMLLSARFWVLFGADPVARLIALGIVTYFAPRAMYALVAAPLNAGLQLLGEFSKIVRQLSDREFPSDLSFDVTVAWAAWMVESAAQEAYRALNRLFEQLPVSDVIVAIAAWVLIGHLLSGATDATRQGQLRLFVLLRKLSQPQQRIASLAVVFLVGIYFSTAAIVAIPWLQGDKGPQTFNHTALEKALEPLTPKDDKNPLLTPVSNTATDQFKIITTAIEDTRKRLEAERATSVKQVPVAVTPQLFTELTRVASEAKQDRDRASELRTQLRDDYLERRSRIAAEALAVFDAETVVPMNNQERAFVFHSIQRSAYERVQEMERLLRDCSRRLMDLDKQFELAATDVAGILKGGDGMTIQAYGQANNRLSSLRGSASTAIRVCEAFPDARLYVSAPDPGAGWGPFAVVSQWLLRTRSQELALITGMFGFGLLGSAITTFVRPAQRRRDADVESLLGSVAGEVASIVARGLSAAIVVFLAVKGGLAIFSGGETEPNAYVLFFTCLVGAVFSEKVWEWARRKLGEGLPLTPQPKGGKLATKKP